LNIENEEVINVLNNTNNRIKSIENMIIIDMKGNLEKRDNTKDILKKVDNLDYKMEKLNRTLK